MGDETSDWGPALRYTGLAVLKEDGTTSTLNEDVGPDCRPVFPPDEHRGVALHWLRDPGGKLVVAEWMTEGHYKEWYFVGDEVDRSPGLLGADGYSWHSVVIVPEH